ncbi:hypothetical protein MVI01_56580 [Myxococcus virescens]|uniref:Uncharacterized protein n=1 Tax=Myxococcus virescens TaxID=83456 RepID=A0A511HKF7_9BACT|nr:hypothetical protein MVI01_56580 [Myxococcus virescens]SDE81950.1 hypothetical protein SAMN04488504_112162 [Myxococcus virescens]
MQTWTLSAPARLASVVPGSDQVCVSAVPTSETQGSDAGPSTPAQSQPVYVLLAPPGQQMMDTMPTP